MEQYFHMVLIMLYKVVLAFKSVDKTLVCDQLNESFWEYFHMVLFIMLYKVVPTLKSGWKRYCG